MLNQPGTVVASAYDRVQHVLTLSSSVYLTLIFLPFLLTIVFLKVLNLFLGIQLHLKNNISSQKHFFHDQCIKLATWHFHTKLHVRRYKSIKVFKQYESLFDNKISVKYQITVDAVYLYKAV